ncbi:coniferyl aldehyde dehydrogenase [Vibrio japonicus]|uniref:Aldehyde dehydrogenase n=1 Tax=Vibrio japonicus TaxID=1824638 RepID=A0ABY5LNG9_9VIBR|nr:coniferyl aldehyde dehydrogenase [Vibrio japonicus]UUM32966.1 coniferyl aldehyde dehydrogenase [Vibrio japonicus]
MQAQKYEFNNSGQESYQERKEHLTNLKKMINDNRESLIKAIQADYGHRSYHETLIAEIIPVTDDITFNIKHLKKWMKPQSRKIDQVLYTGAKNKVIPQAVGVVGIITPWNFPLNLSFSVISAAFAAGNRAMVKMSENSIQLTRLLNQISPKYFSSDKLAFFEETGGVGIEFSKLPFDHLFFTGSGETGRKVMAAASVNLTPVSLELGGKSPAIIAPDFPMEKAVERIMYVKQFNAGQICVNVDYAFVPENKRNEFVSDAKAWVKKHCPDINSQDYTSIIDDTSFQRLLDTVEDAQNKGAEVINLSEQDPDSDSRKFPLMLIINPNEDAIISQRETFGPILMVNTYQDSEQVIDYVIQRDRPLAMYPFTNDKQLADFYIERLLSGGVCVNDALFHVAQHDMPFGGIGASGMGHYHGYEGFLTFSKLRPVFYRGRFSSMKYFMPPYTRLTDKALKFVAKLKS